jgi:hypothetical protein
MKLRVETKMLPNLVEQRIAGGEENGAEPSRAENCPLGRKWCGAWESTKSVVARKMA